MKFSEINTETVQDIEPELLLSSISILTDRLMKGTTHILTEGQTYDAINALSEELIRRGAGRALVNAYLDNLAITLELSDTVMVDEEAEAFKKQYQDTTRAIRRTIKYKIESYSE